MSFFKYLLTGVIVGGVTFVSSILINNKSIDEQLEKKSPSIEKIIIQEKTKDDELKRRLIGIKEKYLDDKIDIETTKAGKQDKNTYQVVVADRIFNMNEFKGENKHIEDMIKNVDLIVEFYKRHSNADKDLAEFFKYDVYSEVRDSVEDYIDKKSQIITQEDCISFNEKCKNIQDLYGLMKKIAKEKGYLIKKPAETIEKPTKTPTEKETLPAKQKKTTPILPYEIQEKEYKKGGFVEIRKYNDCRMSLYVEYQKDSGTEKTEYFIKDNKTLTGFPIKNYNGKTTLENALIKIDAEDTAKACCGTLNDMVIDYYNNAKIINKVYTFEISNKAFKEYIKKAAIFNK